MELGDADPRGLTALGDIDLRELVDISEPRDVHLSVYLPTGSAEEEALNRSFVSSRVDAIRKVLTGDLEEDFEETFAAVGEVLFHDPVPGERGRVVFACAPSSFFRAHRLGVGPQRLLVLDNSPYVLPLAKLLDDHEDYAIILMDSQEARLYVVRSKVLEEVGSSAIDLMGRHHKGGMSQKRFNRLRRGTIDRFVSDIVGDLAAVEDLNGLRGVLVAGPGEEKKRLLDGLPRRLADLVIDVVDVPIDVPPHELVALGEEAALAEEEVEEGEAMAELRRAVFKDELAALGLIDVRAALVQGRAETLLVLDGLSSQGWICEDCKRVLEGWAPPGVCPSCGGPVSRAELVEELYELAERTDADLEVVGASPFLEAVGGVAAILRF